MIIISVAHTKLAPGARTSPPEGVEQVYEYDVSKRASRACFEALCLAQVPAMLVEAGWFTRDGAMAPKQKVCAPATMAVEIHFNASAENPRANYSEVIHHPKSKTGLACATEVSSALAAGFLAGNHKWSNRGPRGDGGLFFLKAPFPAVIVEGLFGSNAEQAAFLASSGGPESYGMLVAEGLKKWWSKR